MNKKREEFFDTSGVLMDCPYEVACEIWKAAQAAVLPFSYELLNAQLFNLNEELSECQTHRGNYQASLFVAEQQLVDANSKVSKLRAALQIADDYVPSGHEHNMCKQVLESTK